MSLEVDIADAVRGEIVGCELQHHFIEEVDAFDVVAAGALPNQDTVIRDWLLSYEMTETNKVRISIVVAGTETTHVARAALQDLTKVIVITQRKFDFRTSTGATVVAPNTEQIDEMSLLTEELRRLFEPSKELILGTRWDSVEDSVAFEAEDMQQLHQYTSVLEHNFRTIRTAAA